MVMLSLKFQAVIWLKSMGGKWLFGIGTFITTFLTLLTPVAAKASTIPIIAAQVSEGFGKVSLKYHLCCL